MTLLVLVVLAVLDFCRAFVAIPPALPLRVTRPAWLPSAGVTSGLSMSTPTIYGVPNSGWKSPQWNWGSASGTGHDCAAICRRTYGTKEARQQLVSSLLSGGIAVDFEEVKLTMALAWQNGRWDGSDGGDGGYGDVLTMMAQAKRYEEGSEEERARKLVEDMRPRFALLSPTKEQMAAMDGLTADLNDVLAARNRCCGLVLQAMGFVENG
ncbi:unnamed protein product [Ectocarpus sp. 12 AP-2014]